MSICSKWSREYGCSCCENQDACHERGIDPLENATDEELEDLDVEPSDAGNQWLLPQKRTDDSQFRCTVCGRIGTVGRCCGLDTREPLNDLARAELAAEEQRKANAAHPKAHNHIWREGPMPTEEKGKDALLASVIRCGTAGRWLRGGEMAWGAELEAEGKVSLCCGGEAATFIDQSNAPLERTAVAGTLDGVVDNSGGDE